MGYMKEFGRAGQKRTGGIFTKNSYQNCKEKRV